MTAKRLEYEQEPQPLAKRVLLQTRPLLGALAAFTLSCGLVTTFEAPIKNVCSPEPMLTAKDRFFFEHSSRVIDQILRRSFPAELVDGINSGQIHLVFGIANGELSPKLKPLKKGRQRTTEDEARAAFAQSYYYDQNLCGAFMATLNQNKTPNKEGKVDYFFPQITISPEDSWLKEIMGEQLGADLWVRTQFDHRPPTEDSLRNVKWHEVEMKPTKELRYPMFAQQVERYARALTPFPAGDTKTSSSPDPLAVEASFSAEIKDGDRVTNIYADQAGYFKRTVAILSK